MVLNGLTKGVLMLVLAAAFTWFLVTAFERGTQEKVNTSRGAVDVPALAAKPGKRTDSQWMF